ncbi:hypothetical protein SAMN05216241_101235 [Limimonas halophila]|uniref:Uncharacterized protein n=1 Tax=Limimonas halophila TaxID=1082479 RepID=A0A1G7LFP8_9PROT|nr:hypothetical protein [Limimonas halophila]SDF48392.1 hypothetical protein SAMN05216241_101235 [Limimonas halophila]
MGLFSRKKKRSEAGAGEQAAAEPPKKKQLPTGRVRIDSREHPLIALDRKHVLVDALNRDFVDGQRIHFAFVLPTDDGDIDAPTQGTIIKVADGRIIARYLAPQPYYQNIMRRVADSLPYVPDVHEM